MPIGAYLPSGMMRPVHVDPAEAVLGFLECEAAVAIPIHHGTFKLGMEGQDQPIKALDQALLQHKVLPSRFEALAPGASRAVPILESVRAQRMELKIGQGTPGPPAPPPN